jgi:outer membrane immunogenic protein
MGWGNNMKRILIAGALALAAGGQALAADLPQPAPPPPRAPATYVPAPVALYNWTGFYIGGNLGGDWNQGGFTDTDATFFGASNTIKFLGGGQAGFNYQFGGGVVIGAEADFDWSPNSNNTVSAVTVNGIPVSVTVNNGWLTTFTGRLGYAWDRVLVYGKGGGAWLGSSNSNITVGSTTFSPSTSNSNFGWTIGAGIEYAFWGNFSARFEYDYIGINSQTFTVAGLGAPFLLASETFTGNNRSLQMVNLGINYKFGY